MYPHHDWTKVCRVCKWTYSTGGYQEGTCNLCAPWHKAPPDVWKRLCERRATPPGAAGEG